LYVFTPLSVAFSSTAVTLATLPVFGASLLVPAVFTDVSGGSVFAAGAGSSAGGVVAGFVAGFAAFVFAGA
jgi:hypothetical protein